jgi:hypothetical protein
MTSLGAGCITGADAPVTAVGELPSSHRRAIIRPEPMASVKTKYLSLNQNPSYRRVLGVCGSFLCRSAVSQVYAVS